MQHDWVQRGMHLSYWWKSQKEGDWKDDVHWILLAQNKNQWGGPCEHEPYGRYSSERKIQADTLIFILVHKFPQKGISFGRHSIMYHYG
jgi:hypothetical protein